MCRTAKNRQKMWKWENSTFFFLSLLLIFWVGLTLTGVVMSPPHNVYIWLKSMPPQNISKFACLCCVGNFCCKGMRYLYWNLTFPQKNCSNMYGLNSSFWPTQDFFQLCSLIVSKTGLKLGDGQFMRTPAKHQLQNIWLHLLLLLCSCTPYNVNCCVLGLHLYMEIFVFPFMSLSWREESKF